MLNISNSISIVRFFLAFPLAWAIYVEDNFWVIILGVLVFVSDYADGYFARKFNEVTETGKVIDPVADKVVVIAAVIALLLSGKTPLWFVVAVVLRDLLIMAAAVSFRKKLKGFTIPSNLLGKITINIITGIFLMQYLEVVYAYGYGSLIGIVFLLSSLFVYAVRANRYVVGYYDSTANSKQS